MPRPRLGIAFVAMKRNIADLPELVRLGKSLGADQFSISNVLPHTPELRDEMLYLRSFYESDLASSEWSPLIALPRLDINALTGESLLSVMQAAPLALHRRARSGWRSKHLSLHRESLAVRALGRGRFPLPVAAAHPRQLFRRSRA